MRRKKAKTTFAERLRDARERNAMSIKELAEDLGVTYQYIWQLEHGVRKNPSEAFCRHLCRALGEDYLWIRHGERKAVDPKRAALSHRVWLLKDEEVEKVDAFVRSMVELHEQSHEESPVVVVYKKEENPEQEDLDEQGDEAPTIN